VSEGDGPSPRSVVAHTFVERLDQPELAEGEWHHLQRVRRLRDGEVITVGDGSGRWRAVRLGPVLEPCGSIVTDPAPHPRLTVAFAPAKGDRPEWVVQKLTELGVDRIVPLRAERGVVRWDDERAPRQVERLQRVAREAAAQSRRTWLPEVTTPVDLAQALRWGAVSIADAGAPGLGESPSLARPAVLVGPEGGWSEQERRLAAELGVPVVELGPHVLRAETAAVAAGVLLVAARTARPAG
jgi:16S rRNA (uracil1498-N3)-methyltransferase